MSTNESILNGVNLYKEIKANVIKHLNYPKIYTLDLPHCDSYTFCCIVKDAPQFNIRLCFEIENRYLKRNLTTRIILSCKYSIDNNKIIAFEQTYPRCTITGNGSNNSCNIEVTLKYLSILNTQSCKNAVEEVFSMVQTVEEFFCPMKKFCK